MAQPPVLPPEVLQALERGNLLAAIKLLRQQRGLGLREAKEYLEAMQQAVKSGELRKPVAGPAEEAGMRKPLDVQEALRAGNKIEAIRRMRENTGMGLKEAKEAVDAMEGAATAAGMHGLAPGQVPDRGRGWLPWVILGLLAAGLYFTFR